MYHLTAKVIFEKSNKKTRSFVNKAKPSKCEHEDYTYSGRTDNVFSKEDQFIHAGTIEPYNHNLIQKDKSYMLFTLKADGFDSLPAELDVETQLVCGVGKIQSKGSEFITGRKTKDSRQSDPDDKRFGKIYCYSHSFLFRFPFQELDYIYKTTDSDELKVKIEKVIEKLTIPNEERIFFRYQSHLAPGTLILKYILVLYDQITYIKHDQQLSTELQKATQILNLHFYGQNAIAFLNSSIELLRRDLSNLYYPSLWALVNHLGIEPKGELLQIIKQKNRFDAEILKNKEIDQKYFDYAQGKLILEYLVHYPLQQEHLEQIFSMYTIQVASNKKSQTIDFLKLDDFDKKDEIKEVLHNPYKIFEDYIDGNGIPLLFEDIDWGEKSRLGIGFESMNLYRLRAMIIDYIQKQENSSGHVWVDFESLQEYILDKLTHLDGRCNDFTHSVKSYFQTKAFLRYFEVDHARGYVTTKKLAAQEKTIRNVVIEKISSSDFEFIAGVAGSGKSYKLCQHLNTVCLTQTYQVLSPTGKSANVLRNKIYAYDEFSDLKNHLRDNRDNITTAHQYLVSQGFWHQALFTLCEPKHITQKQLDLLVIDEISMFTLDLLYMVLKSTNAKKIMLLGDTKQLQPIGYGSVAHSIYVFLKTNYKDNLIELTESRRAKEGAKFIDMSLLLRSKEDLSEELSKYFQIQDNTLQTAYYAHSNELLNLLERSFSESMGCTQFSENILKLASLENIDKLQIISPTNIGEYGTYSINKLIKNQLGNDYKYNKTIDFLKYIKLTNNNQTGVVNGMFGAANIDGRILFENGKEESYNAEAHNLGYAISIHKSQGSGFENVVLIIPEHNSSNFTKELLYTALTRASKKLYIFIHKNNKDFYTQLVCQNDRNMNIFEIDKLRWSKYTLNKPMYYSYIREYRTKQDLYFGLLINHLKNLDIQDTRYLYNGVFTLWYEQLNLNNYVYEEKKKIGNTNIYEMAYSINFKDIVRDYNLEHNFKDRSSEVKDDFMLKMREETLQYNYIIQQKNLDITAHNGLKPRSWSEAILMLLLDILDIDYEYEMMLEDKLLPDFKVKNEDILIEHLGMLDDEDYTQHWEKKKELYMEKGYKVVSIKSLKHYPESKVCIFTTENDFINLIELEEKLKILYLERGI